MAGRRFTRNNPSKKSKITRWGIDSRRPSGAWSSPPGTEKTRRRAGIGAALQGLLFPLYAFVRRQVHDADQARDLTQAYFLKLLEKDYLGDVDRSAGRFRSFLLASVKHFLLNE